MRARTFLIWAHAGSRGQADRTCPNWWARYAQPGDGDRQGQATQGGQATGVRRFNLGDCKRRGRGAPHRELFPDGHSGDAGNAARRSHRGHARRVRPAGPAGGDRGGAGASAGPAARHGGRLGVGVGDDHKANTGQWGSAGAPPMRGRLRQERTQGQQEGEGAALLLQGGGAALVHVQPRLQEEAVPPMQ